MNSGIQPGDPLEKLIAAVTVFSRRLLITFADQSANTRDIIIRNFIARSITSVLSIHSLAMRGRPGDCWTLFRAMTDRLFHLHWLGKHDEFEQFEKWSFIEQYEKQNRLLSDPTAIQHRGERFKPTPEQKRRYRQLKGEQFKWSRPHAEDAAKSLGMPFLYKYGYDFASTHVHPMASDGQDEYLLIAQGRNSDDVRIVLEDAILIYTMILQEGLNSSTLLWRQIVYRFLEEARRGIVEESDYHTVLQQLETAGPEFLWGEPREGA